MYLTQNQTYKIRAEKEGFEPPELLHSTVFKTAAFDRSAISPLQKYKIFNTEKIILPNIRKNAANILFNPVY